MLRFYYDIDDDIKNKIEDFIASFSKERKYEFFTSGTTGPPRKISLSGEKLWYSATKSVRFLNLNSDMNALIALNTENIAGKMMLLRCMVANMNCVIVTPKINPLVGIENYKIDFAALSTNQFYELLQHRSSIDALNNLKLIIVGGDSLHLNIEAKAKKLICAVYHTYGMTETASHFALRLINTDAKQSLFYPIYPLDLSLNEESRLMVRSFVTDNEWFTTGDIAQIEGNGFGIFGRAHHVIISGGVKIQPEKVEQAFYSLYEMPCLCVGKPDEKLGQKCVLFIEAQEDTLNAAKVMDRLKPLLQKYECPKEIYFITALPRTPTGKLLRNMVL